MKPTFYQLRRYLTHKEVKKLIELYNKLYGAYDLRTLNRVWQRNYWVLGDLIHDLDYRGPFRFDRLKKFIEDKFNTARKQQDDELFKRIAQQKQQLRQKKEQRKMYKQSIKDTAAAQRDLMNINYDFQGKASHRASYEANLNRAEDKSFFKQQLQSFIRKLKTSQNIEVDVSNSKDLRLAFAESIRSFLRNPGNSSLKPVLQLIDLQGQVKHIVLGDRAREHIDNILDKINGELTMSQDRWSDDEAYIAGSFIPVVFRVRFLDKEEIRKDREDLGDELDLRDFHEGGFWKYINLSGVDLSVLQIFSEIKPQNYRDNCFVYACIQSGVFTNEEIDYLRSYIQTRKLPNKLIQEIAQMMHCHFVIKRINENNPTKNQTMMRVDTRKSIKEVFTREVQLLLFKNHYMLCTNVPVTPFYIKNKELLDRDYDHIPQERRQLIRGLNPKGFPIYRNEGTHPMKILRLLFELNLFREITTSEYDLLRTCEFSNKLQDYKDLDYNESLCTREIKEPEYLTGQKQIYYADFETDVTVSPHRPYLCCVITEHNAKYYGKTLTGQKINEQLLDFLQPDSITYFHNLKYDVCFFINTPGWKVSITERNGTVLKVTMCKYSSKDKHNRTRLLKKLTFKNSYSIIPAPLRDFASMFKLNVHKEIMAYKLYTEKNIAKGLIDPLLFQLQYYRENRDRISIKTFHQDCLQLMKNIEFSKSLVDNKVDIMKYAQFYCMKDCIVLMQGMKKFNEDLQQVVRSLMPQKTLDVNSYISISAVGYAITRMYGCFNGCYELAGKPQDFISRCICGGRTMTRDNTKQLVQGRIQDFDAVSLYPSAMYIMSGIPKGTPKVIDDLSVQSVLAHDYFFIEIRVKSIKAKSKTPYAFSQLYSINENGSKIFSNEPLDSFYLDKRALLDLMEFYDVEFEVLRGYYFNEGFNARINELISRLFDLRKQYKAQGNPLQSTIKLLLNSIYGKSILKPTKTEIKVVEKKDLDRYLFRYYNYIEEVNENQGIQNVFVKKIKPVNKHFNLPQFGASVLSWSKHLMNRVMCLAEQNDIRIFYQDTDSMHLFESDVHLIARLFREKYGQELIGESMTQFHNDFDGFAGSVGKIYSRKLIALGKKSYLDILVDEKGNEGYHIRLKGIPKQVILNKCRALNVSVEALYMKLLEGEEIEFDLLDGANCFRKNRTYQQTNMESFKRKVRFA